MSETKWYSGGQKLSQWSFMGGELDGLETNWYENGQKSSELTYKDGEVFSSKNPSSISFLERESKLQLLIVFNTFFSSIGIFIV